MRKSLLFFILCLCITHVIWAQKVSITGQVIDETGGPVVGASVIEEGTTNGTITDVNGDYLITVKSGETSLLFSFIGMKSQKIVVNNRTTINITMEPDVIGLEEVVAIGYGTAQKNDLTGAVVSANLESASRAPNVSVLQAIQGNMPGVNVGAVSNAGDSPNLSIRGTNSLSASNAPLIVLDGIIFNGAISSLNVNDVERIDFLKDASAAAVYGSRASNGVVIITTKTGKSEKPLFNFNVYGGVQEAANLMDMMNGEEYVQKLLDWREAQGFEADPSKVTDYLNPLEVDNYINGTEVNWNDELYRVAPISNYELSVSGKTDKTSYYLSGSFTDQEGILKGDDFQRTTIRANFKNDITEWLTIGMNSSYTYRDYSGQSVNAYPGVVASPLSTIYKNGKSGELNLFPQTDQLIINPLTGQLSRDQDIRENLFGAFFAEIQLPIDGLSFKFDYSRSMFKKRTARYYGLDTKEGKDDTGRGSKYHQLSNNWLMNNILTYSKTFNNDHRVGATVVYTRDYEDAETSSLSAIKFANHTLGYNSLEIGETQTVASGAGDSSNEGFMARANYSFKDKYLVSATFRRDGYSGFAKNNKYANFYSGSLAWVLTEEKFMEDISWMDFLKLRLSYGENGNQGLGSYSSLATMGESQYVFGDGGSTSLGLSTGSIENSDLKWETTKSTNLGLNFSLFNQRISGDIDVYRSKTNDLLVKRSLTRYTGYSNIWTNLGEIQNKGLELFLEWSNVKTSDFSWNSSFTYSINRNEIVSLYGEDNDGDGVEDDDVSRGWFIGESLGAIYGYQTDGIYQEGDDIPSGFRPGWFRIKDTDGEDGITPDDRTIYGNSSPNYRFGIKNELNYKNFSFSFFINSIQGGNNWYLGDNRALNPNTFFPGRVNNVDIDYWTPENPSNSVPAINYSPRFSHRFNQDRSFIRLQDVTFSYDLTKKSLIKNLNIKGLRFYVSGKNLATWTKWTGYDPELGSTLFGTPSVRSYVIGANINF